MVVIRMIWMICQWNSVMETILMTIVLTITSTHITTTPTAAGHGCGISIGTTTIRPQCRVKPKLDLVLAFVLVTIWPLGGQ